MDSNLGRLLGAREIDGDGGPAADLAFDADLAARLVSEAENLGKPQAGALADRFGREERLECVIEHLRRHSAAGVGDADLHVIARADVPDLVCGEADVVG